MTTTTTYLNTLAEIHARQTAAKPDPIAVLLRRLRKERGESLVNAEERTGIPAVVAGSWERGDRRPTLPSVRAWLAHYGYQLIAVPDTHVMIPATAGHDAPISVEWGVDLGDDQPALVVDGATTADLVASHIPGATVVCRVKRVGDWQAGGLL